MEVSFVCHIVEALVREIIELLEMKVSKWRWLLSLLSGQSSVRMGEQA